MPSGHVVRRSPVVRSFRVDQVRGMFDISEKPEVLTEWNVSIPIEAEAWQIGAIVGASGSGKTTIATELFKHAHLHTAFEWDSSKSILDDFPSDIETREVVEMLSSVGLSSPPHWLKPFAHLSNGQKFRVELARLLLSRHETVLFDEFTSVVDRDVAKVCCSALAKTIRRRQRPQLVAISCHFDILDWLQPDWVFDVSANRFELRRLLRRPEIKLNVYRTHYSAWSLFRGHHYLDTTINKAAACYVALWNDRPVAFASFLPFVHAQVKRAKREHRTVVLPDFQGVGIGNKLSEFIGELCIRSGFRYFSTTSHPSMIRHRSKSPLWSIHRFGHAAMKGFGDFWPSRSNKRATAGFEYIGNHA